MRLTTWAIYIFRRALQWPAEKTATFLLMQVNVLLIQVATSTSISAFTTSATSLSGSEVVMALNHSRAWDVLCFHQFLGPLIKVYFLFDARGHPPWLYDGNYTLELHETRGPLHFHEFISHITPNPVNGWMWHYSCSHVDSAAFHFTGWKEKLL